jgi:hypothetical protein
MTTSKHFSELDIRHAIQEYLHNRGFITDPTRISFLVDRTADHYPGDPGNGITATANVTEIE